jgi:hypothetical protein
MLGCYDYVARPYEAVSALLVRDPLGLLQRATTSATVRAQSLAASLRVELAGLEVSADVRLRIRRVRDHEMLDGALPALRIELAWEAIHHPALFPSMLAEVVAWPLSARETQVEIQGTYWIPIGIVGSVFHAAIGQRIAEASVHRFLGDLIEQLQSELPSQTAGVV